MELTFTSIRLDVFGFLSVATYHSVYITLFYLMDEVV